MQASPEMTRLLDDTFGREGVKGWEKTVYKGTDCGAWIRIKSPDTVQFGSIVEGCDNGAESITLTMPFTGKEVWDSLTRIEKDCDRIWMDTHGCPDCYPGFHEPFEDLAVNPECKGCAGQGIVI